MNFSTFTFSNDRNNLIIFSLTSYHILVYPSWLLSSGDLDYEVSMKPKQSHRCLIFYNCQKFCILKIILCVKKGPAEWDRLSSIMQFLQKIISICFTSDFRRGKSLKCFSTTNSIDLCFRSIWFSTVLCKSNPNENRRISLPVLSKFYRTFMRKFVKILTCTSCHFAGTKSDISSKVRD